MPYPDSALLASFRRHESSATKTFSLSQTPPVFVSGQGAWLIDDGGRRYLDFACGSAVSSLGHANPAVHAAIEAQLATGILHIGPHFHTRSQSVLFEQFSPLLPPHLRYFHPATNGTEATESALKACMHYTGRRRFIGFSGGYHGRTAGALAVSGAKGANAVLEPLAPACDFLPYPHCGRCPRRPAHGCCGADEQRLVETITAAGSTLAGVIIEPVQATAGFIVPPASFLRAVAAATRQAGVPLIVDEVLTGFGRSGRLFAFQHYAIEPDLVIFAKSFGGGLPGGLLAGREEILTCWPPGAQSSTFQLHPLTAATAAAALDQIRRLDLPRRARLIDHWMAAWRARLLALPSVYDVRGLGAMHGIEIGDRDGRPDQRRCQAVRRRALTRGLITWECGTQGQVIGLLPPLTISRDEFDQAMTILCAALAHDLTKPSMS